MELLAHCVVQFVVLYLCAVNIVFGAVYKWIHEPPDYASQGRFLNIPPIKVIQNRHIVTQCAMDCLKTAECQSFNFLRESSVCVLIDKTHMDVDGAVLSTNQTSQYYKKDAFSIDPLALGPCAGVTCQHGGKCIATTDSGDQSVFVCVCKAGWTGEHCQTELNWPSWGDWKPWGSCSVTCGSGWRMRKRDCIDRETQSVTDSFMCSSKDTQIEVCDLQQCPRWNHWGEWGSCSTETTCGKGLRTRTRTCSDNGTPGVDRYCMGPLNETGYCHSIDCRAPVRLKDGPTFGEGRVELFNDQTRSWGLVCADQWDMNAANTACRQMGFSSASDVITDGRYGTGGGSITVADVSCQDGGRKVQGCQHSVWNDDTSCPSSNAAGVKCKVDGDWNMWTDWGECSVTCGDGIQARTRDCNLPPALHGGEDCSGPDTDQRACSKPACPGTGQWATWGSFEACDVTCGDGTQRRYRSCADTEVSCSGDSEESQACSTNIPCPVPGDWDPWSDWSSCSASCDGGSRRRSRQCDMTSHGDLTAPCSGDSDEVEDCHIFPCQPYARSCSGLRQLGLTESVEADIDPDGPGGELPVQVFCDMVAENGLGVTVIGHDHEAEVEVNGYEGAGEYDTGELVYNATWEQVLTLVDHSDHCKQYVSWKCKAALIHNRKRVLLNNEDSEYILTTFWRNRTGGVADYWGGAPHGSGLCDCGVTKTCANPEQNCNCDANDAVWREDAGYITIKNDLPVTSFAAGDTGEFGKEAGIFTIGRLLCVGWNVPTESTE